MRTRTLLAAVAVGLPALAGCSGSLQTLARAGGAAALASMPIGPEKEAEIGFGIAATVAGRYSLVDDPALTRYVNLVGGAVAQQSVRGGEVAFRFGVLDTEEVNAFAAPGGFILVTRGALSLMRSEAELAAVLAHEVAHVDQKHVLDEIRRADVLRSVQDETELTGEVLDRIAEVGGGVLFTGLSREDEMESDSLGVLYASAMGYRPDGLLDFLRRLRGAERGEQAERMRELMATHPSTTDRIGALERQMRARGIDATQGRAVAERFARNVRGSTR
ncbi:MAG: M48 family metalloprotease [Gemmatimonadota bacterium]